MRTPTLPSMQAGPLRPAGLALSLAGLAILVHPSEARAQQNTENSNPCNRDLDCYAGWQSVSWCHEGQCKQRNRIDQACELPGDSNRCWWDGECDDGDPSTVTWCDEPIWSTWNWLFGGKSGRCHVAPRDASACDPGTQAQCRRDRDCSDNNSRTKDWCHEGTCHQARRDDARCVDSGSSCRRNHQCADNDSNTVDWCSGGQCYHAPVTGEGCEPALDCEPVHVVLEHTRRGSVNNPALGDSRWKVIDHSYQIRYMGTSSGPATPQSVQYTCFDLASVPAGTVVSAYMEMTHSGNSYDSTDPSERVGFVPFDKVGCDDPGLNNPVLRKPDNYQEIFDDAQDGPVLAQFTASRVDNGRTESFPVNQTGLANIQARIGQSWGVGGILLDPDPSGTGELERVFRGTDESGGTIQPTAKLVLTIKPDSCGADTRALNPVDLGYYLRGFDTTKNRVEQSFHWESPDREHRTYPVGNLNIDAPLAGSGNIERRSYFVWDVSGITDAVSAKVRIWTYQPSLANAFSGGYTSDDPSETVGLFALENHTPQQVMEAPFNDKFKHDVDIPIWEDLGEGTLYGERVYTVDDELVGLSPSYRADQSISCNPVVEDPGAPCGKWLEFTLNQNGISAINATNGQWGMGMAMTSIEPAFRKKEWTNNGSFVDLAPRKTGIYPTYLAPAPQLIIRTSR